MRQNRLTDYELLRLRLEPFFPPLNAQVRRRLLPIADSCGKGCLALDVGCRTSPYTIGVPARFVLTDLPKTSDFQVKYYLGLSPDMTRRLYQRRSNVAQVLLDDMKCSSLKTEQFCCVVAVEVLEHVERDDLFVAEIRRVLKKGGVFLMTTPNGDYTANRSPDHKRQYTRMQLTNLLSAHFEDVRVDYAIRSGLFYKWGHDSWSLSHPLRTLRIMTSNLISAFQSSGDAIKGQSGRTEHPIAVGRKPQR